MTPRRSPRKRRPRSTSQCHAEMPAFRCTLVLLRGLVTSSAGRGIIYFGSPAADHALMRSMC
eukprot:15442986-Alexandrium_andersonii.AAC.1